MRMRKITFLPVDDAAIIDPMKGYVTQFFCDVAVAVIAASLPLCELFY